MRDYKETLQMSSTPFSLQGVKDEKLFLGIIEQTYRKNQYPTPPTLSMHGNFTLQDGPPYANGNIHMGHALNKILKDFVIRSKVSSGRSVTYQPGWDCHGLPIESQVEKELIAQGISKRDLTVAEFREKCETYAMGWVDTQREQFKALGIMGDWDRPYITSSRACEAQIVENLHELNRKDMLYRGTKPVMWSAVEETALAETEVEHRPLKVSSVHVLFRVKEAKRVDCSIVIWTTTPWTLPANRAIAYNSKIDYAVYQVKKLGPKAMEYGAINFDDKLVIAVKRLQDTMVALDVLDWEYVEAFSPEYAICEHPLRGIESDSYNFEVPLIPARHVTDDAGTGFVHIAPEHGPDDYVCWQQNNMGEVPNTVDAEGAYLPDVPLFAGMKVLRPTPKGDYIFEFMNAEIIKHLVAIKTLGATSKVSISYPHSWRSKAPLFYRNTPQWFISMETVRDTALEHVDKITYVHNVGQNRLKAAIETRPDWLISRQRIWGTPLAIFVHKETGEPLNHSLVNSNIVNAIREHGSAIWWEQPNFYFFENGAGDPDDYEKVTDVLDVWFDSASAHTFSQSYGQHPANLYLEGSDQHRGWFGSSLLLETALNKQTPFTSLLTHGFVLDKLGIKMSKSAGNVVDPLVEAKKHGTDVIRLWVALSDYTQDIRVGDEILKTTGEQYKKLRNTLRFLISNLQGFRPNDELTALDEFPPLERYMLHMLSSLEEPIEKAYAEYRFNDVAKTVMEFCSNTLSAFYFDIRKDCLYCDPKDSIKRRATLTTMFAIFDQLLLWLSPILPFTTEEAWLELKDVYKVDSSLLRRFWAAPKEWLNPTEEARWSAIRVVLGQVTHKLEEARQAKLIGGSLDAAVYVCVDQSDIFDGVDASEVFRTSQATIEYSQDEYINVTRAEGVKCARSWKILPDVGADPRYPDLSPRDAIAVAQWDAEHQ